MSDVGLAGRAGELRLGRTPFVLATVVRAERPTSAKPGDQALVLPDGTVEGFVGGVCAESTMRLESLRMLRDGESGLLRITPGGGGGDAPPEPGLRIVENHCLSGGSLEIFLESVLPAPLVAVLGDAPVARALRRVGAALDYDVRPIAAPAGALPADAAAVVVASHGRDEAAVLTAALRAGVPYVALVASRRRAAAVLGGLDVDEKQRRRVHAPAGLDIGARTPAEIALAIFAEFRLLTGTSRSGDGEHPRAPEAP
ncbi:XdhC family protein [Pseudonocardia hispaniensis]|uniref:XdhC family protein n=1 Tax=Pseudonocardia hispaniensis TaxID=904933 RepID=A0ABW1J2E5_9PSEU